MPWVLSNQKEQARLEREFSRLRIPYDSPGFCDHPAFLAAERDDARFLELYAKYIEVRRYEESYLSDAAIKIRLAANALEVAIGDDGRLGACVDASAMLGRMLDRLGVWNYVAKSTLTITFPKNSGRTPRYFWSFDEGEFAAPHAIVVAPPFGVVDITVRHQAYDANQGDYLPRVVTADSWNEVNWEAKDLANPEILATLEMRGISFRDFLRHRNPSMAEVMKHLPPRQISHEDTKLKYVVVAVGGAIEPLEGVVGYKPCGRTALEIFEQDVKPKLGAQR